MAFASGKNAKIRYGAGPSTLKVKKWMVTPKNPELDVTNTESGGAGEYISGVVDLEFEIEADVPVGDSIFAAFVPGSTVATLKLYENDTTGPFWLMTTAYVRDTAVTAEVRGLVSMRITGLATGGYTAPAT